MANALKKNNVTYQLSTNENWGHMFDGPEKTKELQQVFNEVLETLAEHGTRQTVPHVTESSTPES
jgi:hypothetical protein